jgi:hypothetical protein
VLEGVYVENVEYVYYVYLWGVSNNYCTIVPLYRKGSRKKFETEKIS